MRKGKDPDLYLWLTDPETDPEGPKTYGPTDPDPKHWLLMSKQNLDEDGTSTTSISTPHKFIHSVQNTEGLHYEVGWEAVLCEIVVGQVQDPTTP
jgi:hypothetical protein